MAKTDTERVAEIADSIQQLCAERDLVMDKYLGEGMGQFHKVGYWDCTASPVSVCVYHPFTDPALDRCIYCGRPHERK